MSRLQKCLTPQFMFIVNCLLICVLLLLASTSYDPREGRPVLRDYMERTKDFLNPGYDDAHKIVYQMVKRFGGKIPGRDN